MQSLISPEIFAQAYGLIPNRGAGHMQPVGHVQYHPAQPQAPLYFNMADQQQDYDMQNPAQRLRAAQQLRARNAAGHTGLHPQGVNGGPMADAIESSKSQAMADSGYAPGTMTVTPNSVSPDAMHQMAMRAATNSFGGAVTNPADLTAGQKGFQVSGLQMPQQENPTAAMVNAFKGHVPDQTLTAVQQALAGGAIQPQHALSMLQQAMQHQQTASHQQQLDQEHQQDREHRQLTEKLSDLKTQEHELEGRNKNQLTEDPNVNKDLTAVREQEMNVRSRLMGGRGGGKPQQQQTAQGQQQPPQVSDHASWAALPPGATYLDPQGNLRRKGGE